MSTGFAIQVLSSEDPELRGQRFPLTEAGIAFGRSQTCCGQSQQRVIVWVKSPVVARFHSTLDWDPVHGPLLADQHTTNGTHVGSEALAAPRAMKRGEQFRIGQTTFELVSSP